MALGDVGYSWYLVLVIIVGAILIVFSNLYVLIHYSHPEDRNQAWVPKIIVIFGLSLAVFTVLLYPLDIANVKACTAGLSPSACTFTLPTYQIWLACFISILVMSFAIIPFAVFYYEADSEFTQFQKVKTAVVWTLGLIAILTLIIGILYFLVGYVVWNVQLLSSGTFPLSAVYDGSYSQANYPYPCIMMPISPPIPMPFPPAPPPGSPPPSPPPPPPAMQGSNITLACIANLPNNLYIKTEVLKMRVSLPIYVIAVQSILGWFVFLFFAGVGVIAAPVDWIQTFLARPKTTITKSEYIRRGKVIAQRAKECVKIADQLRRIEKDRRWRNNYKALELQVNSLEEDEYQLERVYPQGEDGEAQWILFVIGFWLTGLLGVVGMIISLAWLCHIGLYMIPPKGPVSPMLNEVFILLDNAFTLLGVAAFSFFCLYLQVVAMKGNFMLGLNFGFIRLYPMRAGATLVSALLVNTAIVLTMTPAILQFCATAFALYGSNSAIFDIFGVQVGYLQGISWIYANNLFIYMFLAVAFITVLFMMCKGPPQSWTRKSKAQKMEEIYMAD